jgi:hypothetical protein
MSVHIHACEIGAREDIYKIYMCIWFLKFEFLILTGKYLEASSRTRATFLQINLKTIGSHGTETCVGGRKVVRGPGRLVNLHHL